MAKKFGSMDIALPSGKIKSTDYIWISVLVGVLVSSCTIFASTLDKKWFVAFLLAIMGFFACLILQKYLRELLLTLAIFVIPLRIDFYIIHNQPGMTASAYPGLPVTFFDIFFCILLFYWLYQVLRGEETIYFYRSITFPFFIYFFFAFISAFESVNYVFSFSAALLILKSYIIFLFFANTIKEKKDILLIVFGLGAGIWMQGVLGGMQYFGIGSFDEMFGVPESAYRTQMMGEHMLSRVGGTFGHPNSLAKYLGFCLHVILAYVLINLRGKGAKFAIMTLLIGGLALLMTFSRATWMAVVVSMSFLLYQVLRGWLKSRTMSMVMVCVMMTALAGITLGVFEDVRIRLFESDYRSAQSRIPMAQVALNVIKHHPLTGVGLNNYSAVMQQYDRTREWQTYQFPHPVHNSYLLIAAESGIPALIAFLFLLAAAMAKVKPALKKPGGSLAVLQAGWFAALLTWLVAALFDRDFAGTNAMLWLTIGMLTAIHRQMTATSPDSVRGEHDEPSKTEG